MIADAFARALLKVAGISDDDARRSLDRLDTLERTKPTARQVGRYAAIGAAAAPAIGALANVVKGKPAFEGTGGFSKLRDAASTAVKGGLGASVIPLARTHLDRKAELGTLRRYVADQPKLSFAVSAYSGPLNPSFLRMESQVPPLAQRSAGTPHRAQRFVGPAVGEARSPTRGGFLLASPQPMGKAAADAAARTLAARRRSPNVKTPPGPSIAEISKPVGFGRPLPGALKNSI
jgi:hypothetical protein